MKKIYLLFLNACLFSGALLAQDYVSGTYTVENLKKVNSEFNDFSPVMLDNKLVFASTREKSGIFDCKDPAGRNFMGLWSAKEADEGFGEPVLMQKELNGPYHDGPVIFSPDGNTMYFCRSNMQGKNDENTFILKIYSATKKAGVWGDIKELGFNSESFSNSHPALTADGNRLYFASDRPSSKGKTDIYYVDKQGDAWGEPVNAGDINTKAKESFPTIYNDMIFFSSDRKGTTGKLDIYKTALAGGEVLQLPAPLNSKGDDFGLFMLEDGVNGYFSSSRRGGKGADDIWKWSYEELITPINVIVYLTGTEQIIEGANVTITPDDMKMLKKQNKDLANQPKAYQSSKEAITYNVLPDAGYTFGATKEGYEPFTGTSTFTKLPNGETGEYIMYLTPIVVEKRIPVNLLVVNKLNAKPIPTSSLTIIDLTSNVTNTYETSNLGTYSFEYICGHNYEIHAFKPTFSKDVINLIAQNIDCETTEELNLTLELLPELKKDVVLELEYLYYDFDKANIRPDAAIELDKVVSIMNDYPGLEIELGSHTDARGRDAYNEDLSSRRATAAVQYIISKGIASTRIVAKGYGETQLRNGCANGVECTEEEHQRNRRTEIKVTKVGDTNIEIKVLDN